MKYVLSTIAFALLLSNHQSAAFNGSGLMRQGPDKAQNAQVNNKVQAVGAATDVVKKEAEAKKKAQMEAARKRVEAQKRAEAAKKAQQTPVQSSDGVNDAQLMTPDANADRNRGVAQGGQSQQQSQQQNVEPSQEGGDTLRGNNKSYVPQAQGNDTDSDSKQDDGKVGFFSGGKMMWLLIALAVVVVLFFASRKNSPGRQPKPAVGDGLSDEEKEIAALHKSFTKLKAEVEVLKQQNIELKKELETVASRRLPTSTLRLPTPMSTTLLPARNQATQCYMPTFSTEWCSRLTTCSSHAMSTRCLCSLCRVMRVRSR